MKKEKCVWAHKCSKPIYLTCDDYILMVAIELLLKGKWFFISKFKLIYNLWQLCFVRFSSNMLGPIFACMFIFFLSNSMWWLWTIQMVSTRQGTHTFEAKMVRYKEKARWKHHAKKVVPSSTTNVHGVQMQGPFFNHKFLLEIINQPLITPLLQLIVSCMMLILILLLFIKRLGLVRM